MAISSIPHRHGDRGLKGAADHRNGKQGGGTGIGEQGRCTSVGEQ